VCTIACTATALRITIEVEVTQVALPDYQRVVLPLLQVASDEREHSLSDAIDTLVREFRLSPEERAELLPSGRQARFDNRVAWALT
jgi:restriction system protein